LLYVGPVISSGGVNIGLSGSGSVTVTGLNFGSAELTASIQAFDTLASTLAWTSVTSVEYLSNAAVFPQTDSTAVTVGGSVGTGQSMLSFDGTDHSRFT
jgi:hypothetical protein